MIWWLLESCMGQVVGTRICGAGTCIALCADAGWTCCRAGADCTWCRCGLRNSFAGNWVLSPWASEGFFPGVATRGFFQNFSRGDQKWWNLVFTPQNWKNNLFCWNFQNPGRGQGPPANAHGWAKGHELNQLKNCKTHGSTEVVCQHCA